MTSAEAASSKTGFSPVPEVVEPTEVIEEKPVFEDVAMEDVVHETAEAAEVVPDAMEDLVAAINKENTAQEIAEAVKTVSSKLGEQSTDGPTDGLAPLRDLRRRLIW